jgi:hypothetical protein
MYPDYYYSICCCLGICRAYALYMAAIWMSGDGLTDSVRQQIIHDDAVVATYSSGDPRGSRVFHYPSK